MKKTILTRVFALIGAVITVIMVAVVPAFAIYDPPIDLTDEELEIYNMSYQSGNDDGYNRGYDLGYQFGIQEGYENGKADGESLHADDWQNGYNEGIAQSYDVGYSAGYEDGEVEGWKNGEARGMTDAMNTKDTVKDMVFAIFDAPTRLIDGMLDFNLFGINLASTVKVIVTLAVVSVIIAVIIKFSKG